MRGQAQQRSVLVIEPDQQAAQELERALAELGVEASFAGDAVTGWELFARGRPQTVLSALETPRKGGAWFLRRLQSEYMGTMPQVYLLCRPEELSSSLQALEPDGVILPPISRQALATLVGAVHEIGDTPMRQAARLRELYEITSLGGEQTASLDTLVARTALTFRVSDAVLWGPAHEGIWPRTARKLKDSEAEAELMLRCDLALTTGSTVLMSAGEADEQATIVDGPARSYVAAPIELPGGTEIGALCLVDDGARRFAPDERDALRVLARRLSTEMSWIAAHNRLLEDHEKLRESSLLDPLLGVWTRAALESSLQNEIERARRRSESLAVAVLDVDQLRQINDRYGHVAGDEALAHLARVTRETLRTQDIIGRFGGDEVAVVLTGTALADAEKILAGLVEAVRHAPLLHHGLQIGLGVAVGVTTVHGDEETGDAAFGRAVLALRRARRTRAPVVAIDPDRQGGATDTSAPDAEMDDVGVLPPGSTLGGMYRILHEISRGAMGVVYRGEDLGLGRPVAIKVLRSDLAQDDDLVARFRDEATMLASLHHPNLVQVYSFGAQADDVYFVMELVEGEPLSEILRGSMKTGEHIEPALAGKVVAEIAGALDAMHNVGLIHRDVKPSNVLIDRLRERAVLVDVGVAKRREDKVDAAGTPGFAAPEAFMDAEETPATDAYGLASTAYMMLTGVTPFGSGDVERVIQRQLHGQPQPPSRYRPELSPEVDAVMLRGLRPRMDERYTTASAFARALVEALRDDEEELTRPDSLSMSRRTSATIPPPVADPLAPRARPNMPLTTRRRAFVAADTTNNTNNTLGQTRGAVFRVAYRILGNKLGADWMRQLAKQSPMLVPVLDPALAPMSWQSVDRLIALLNESMKAVNDPGAFATAIGRATMTATFARFFGANPQGLPPGKVLRAASSYWSRYHTWGSVTAEQPRPHACELYVHGSPGEPLLCALIEGSFARIAELTGAIDVRTTHPECVAGNHVACKFEVDWHDAVGRVTDDATRLPRPIPPLR